MSDQLDQLLTEYIEPQFCPYCKVKMISYIGRDEEGTLVRVRFCRCGLFVFPLPLNDLIDTVCHSTEHLIESGELKA